MNSEEIKINEQPFMKLDDEKDHSPVHPLCFPVSPNKYFYGFTLFNLYLFSLTNIAIIGYNFHTVNYKTVVPLVFFILLLIWVFIVFTKYKQSHMFVNSLSFLHSLFLVIAASLSLIFVITTLILTVGLKNNFIPELLELNSNLLLGFGIAIGLINAYYIYLCILYLIVIQKAKNAD